jgi:hypothetical protein
MGGTCNRHVRVKIAYKVLVGKQRGDHVEDQGVDGTIILE